MFLKSSFLLLLSFISVYSMPCPSECICKPIDTDDVDFTRLSYLMDCSNQSLKNDRLIHHAEEWSINEDTILNEDEDVSNTDYIISIDLSNSLSIKQFTSETIQLKGFSFSMQSLSLTNQPKSFRLQLNSFNSPLYQNLKQLNLSSCCQTIPKDCPQLFRPLNKLQILDLSGSNMYKTCLDTPETISSELTQLVLRNNIYDQNIFSTTSRLFDGVRKFPGKLDLRNSRFQMPDEQERDCLFNIFPQIIALDLSSIDFQSASNLTELYLLKCKTDSDGQQVLDLYLRQLKLQQLPKWFTADRFPLLRRLDLSNNEIYSIDIRDFTTLRHLSLAYNPIDLKNIVWRDDTIYESLNLRGTIRNQTFDLSRHLKNLFKLTTNIDYSENEAFNTSNLTYIPVEIDPLPNQFSLNISRTNINSFQHIFDDLDRLDISWNSLIKLNLDEHLKLKYLDCSNQYLKRLKFDEHLSELTELKCSNNSLKKIENFSLLKKEQLKLIDLSSNSIDSLESLFTNLTSRYLRTINLKSNLIQIIPSNIFHRKLISLYEINLSWNQIHTIKNDAFQAPNLQILDLRGNLLTTIEPKAILTASLRLFYVFTDTKQLTNRCQQSKSNDSLLLLYVNWLKTNGTLMKDNRIELDQCSKQTKINWVMSQTKHFFAGGHHILYITIGLLIVAVLFVGIAFYRRYKPPFFTWSQPYRRLDRNGIEMTQHLHEDDEIVMNLREAPFDKFSRVRTNV